MLNKDEIYTFKLNSGEELIAKVIKAETDFITIFDPVSVAPGPQGLGLVPSLFTADPEGEIKLNTNSIAVYGMTDEGIKAKYTQATTGIAVPNKKLILG
jgi:hypothetical protein